MILISFKKSAFERQIDEAVLINETMEIYSLNSKQEFRRTLLPKNSVKLRSEYG